MLRGLMIVMLGDGDGDGDGDDETVGEVRVRELVKMIGKYRVQPVIMR